MSYSKMPFLFYSVVVKAQPSNNECTAATSLVINGAVVTGTTVDATSETTSGCGVTKQAPEVFYQVTGNGRRMTATTCFNQTNFATSLALWNPTLCRGSCNQGKYYRHGMRQWQWCSRHVGFFQCRCLYTGGIWTPCRDDGDVWHCRE